MVQIANPIYDAVFRFMMNDNEVAKLLISAIIGQEIQELVFQPTTLPIPLNESITVLQMDFKATIQLADKTTQVVIIEIQKAKLHTDIMRFRKYLGEQYKDKNNSFVTKTVKSKTKENTWIEHRKAFPILSIYFLGHHLEVIKDVPVIKVARTYYDLATGKPLEKKEDFIESLTHDSFIIQIPCLSGSKRTDLERLLQIFDQEEEEVNLKHVLTVQEEDIPEKYKVVVRRLRLAIADARTRQLMDAEDDLIFEFQQYARAVAAAKEETEKMVKEKEKVAKEKEQVVKEKEQVVKEKEQVVKEKEQLAEQAIRKFIMLGLSDEEIAATLNVSINLVEKIRQTIT